MKFLNSNVSFKNQWMNAVALYLAGVISLAVLAYGCKALLNLL